MCKKREVSFYAFHVLEGLEEESRSKKLLSLQGYGFQICPFQEIVPDITIEELELQIKEMNNLADRSDIPIDGMVLCFDSLSYSASFGRTSHHYHYGIAYKFEDIPMKLYSALFNGRLVEVVRLHLWLYSILWKSTV